MPPTHDKRLPGESDAYRQARNALLEAERDLRRQTEYVAAMRRALPLGGRVKEDYVFTEGAVDLSDTKTIVKTRFSDLFAPGKDSLVVYSFMFRPDAIDPCPICNAFLDGLNGNAIHLSQRINLCVVAKAPIERIRDWARKRNWRHMRLLSSGATTYNTDYYAETESGDQLPIINVFKRTEDGIFHTYMSELFYTPSDPGMDPRHVDMMWSLWNVLDITPEGRGTDWYPRLHYD